MKPRLLFTILRHRSLPWTVSLAVAIGMSVSLANQWHQFSELLHQEPVRKQALRDPTITPSTYRDKLFGEPQQRQRASAELTPRLSVTLVGSLVHAKGDRSSAIIAVSGRPPRLFKTGDQLSEGVVLSEVQPDHVILARGNLRDPLYFPEAVKAMAEPIGRVVRHDNLTDAHLKKLQPMSSGDLQEAHLKLLADRIRAR